MLKVERLCTQYTDAGGRIVKAAQDVTFEVPQGEFFTLLGPSGCGKTTTLRSIAGLERPVSGEISVDGVAVYSASKNVFVAPNRRNFGMVFQSYAIWPHMNVFQNAAFPLQSGRAHVNARDIRDRVMRVLETVGLDHLADREATGLSGGQQQRLALARALTMEPRLLLLDEPLSNLDAKLRERMRFELKRLQRELKLTTVYVTHDQNEALALSHNIAVMNQGRIIQIGKPEEIYSRPCDRFVADFVGTTNFIEGTVAGVGATAGSYRVDTPIGVLQATSRNVLRDGDRTVLSVRPEDVEVSMSPAEGVNLSKGVVLTRVYLGESLDLQITVGTQQMLARVHPSAAAAVGDTVHLRIDPEKCIAVTESVPAESV